MDRTSQTLDVPPVHSSVILPSKWNDKAAGYLPTGFSAFRTTSGEGQTTHRLASRTAGCWLSPLWFHVKRRSFLSRQNCLVPVLRVFVSVSASTRAMGLAHTAAALANPARTSAASPPTALLSVFCASRGPNLRYSRLDDTTSLWGSADLVPPSTQGDRIDLERARRAPVGALLNFRTIRISCYAGLMTTTRNGSSPSLWVVTLRSSRSATCTTRRSYAVMGLSRTAICWCAERSADLRAISSSF